MQDDATQTGLTWFSKAVITKREKLSALKLGPENRLTESDTDPRVVWRGVGCDDPNATEW